MLAESTTWVVVTRRGSRARATIADVAREAGVNKGTVSRALRGSPGVGPSTRERIVKVADRLEFSASPMAAALATGQSKTVGIVLPTLRSWYFSEVASAASEVLTPAGFRVELINLDVDSDSLDANSPAFRLLFSELGAGREALLFAGTMPTASGVGGSRRARVPAALAGLPTTSVPGIFVDDHRGGRLVGEHLLELGHRDVAVIDGRRAEFSTGVVWQRRTDGLRDAFADAGIELADDRILRPGGCQAEDGALAMESLLAAAPPLPTAIFCHCDQMAFGVLSVLRRVHLRCPEEISVVAFDDHPLSKYWGLTTVDQHTFQQGQRSALALIRAMGMNRESIVTSELAALEVELIVRETTGPVAV